MFPVAHIPFATTERLRIWQVENVRPSLDNAPRTVYLAFRSDQDRPMVAATAVVWETPGVPRRSSEPWASFEAAAASPGPWLDWLEVSSEQRRQGIATEFLDWLETVHPGLRTDPGTDEGEMFLEARRS